MFLFSPHVGQLTKEGRSCYMTGDLEHCQALLHIVPPDILLHSYPNFPSCMFTLL